MHCSEFVMPESIREFPSLMGIELWNTTLVRWGEESALSAELHPMMLFLIMGYVNMTEALSRNPLRKLPDARNEAFGVSLLSLEFTQIVELPLWVHTNVWEYVSLGGSPICEEGHNASLTGIDICGQDDKSWDPLGEQRFPTQLVEPLRMLKSQQTG
ncbi:hypothetical protein JG687_00018312 [Phytophthora cactorum]|uniref:Uncharacterized protein n=1 Tax=Phytophthora cactorum TaxID=29920 RepID=A0A8T1TL67_9STRA|nr:hypothetical protein JG687_00018312 [Phytophthora cactorum]